MPSLNHRDLNQPGPHSSPGLTEGGDGLSCPLPSAHVVISRGRAALYLLSSGLMACGLIGPVRMGLVVEMAGLSGSGRSFTA